jgi:hypothetical protein
VEDKSDVPKNADKLLHQFEAKASIVIVMNGREWHTSGASITRDKNRALLFGYYTAPFLRQQVNWTTKLPVDVQESLSAQTRESLDCNVTANTGSPKILPCLADQFPGKTTVV